MTGARRTCPSCQARVSPLAVECPVCGLAFRAGSPPRPFLFEAQRLDRPREETRPEAPAPMALQAPAMGRVAPVPVESPLPEAPPPALPIASPVREAFGQLEARVEAEVASFWPLVLLEASEALLLLGANGAVLLLSAWLLHASPVRILREAWAMALPFHLTLSWALLMVPLVLGGQSPLMPRWNLVLSESEPERRMVFSLVHLVSVLAFPLSFLCMVLSPRHLSLAEYLSGQEIINRPPPRVR
ncbi:MAG TPA: hypothetical protein VJ600_09650 [Holophagaceae bacterium]|nr:hypothetical protein [Holophagaceae bacterium]